MEVSLEPFPRRFRPGEACRLRGEVPPATNARSVFLTRPDGKVDETRSPGGGSTSLTLSAPGAIRVEVMSDGAAGPCVLANVPVYVGVDEPGVPASAGRRGADRSHRGRGGADADAAERGPARGGAGAGRCRRALRAVAMGHTEDMIAGRFFGHVSPTTGPVEDRLQRAGVAGAPGGENLAQAETAEQAHRFLMDSPGHRANMLGAKFTHVGIGVASARRGGRAARDAGVRAAAARPSEPVTPALVTALSPRCGARRAPRPRQPTRCCNTRPRRASPS
jgi:hypothetical protein